MEVGVGGDWYVIVPRTVAGAVSEVSLLQFSSNAGKRLSGEAGKA